jgi:hypothetical protein
MKIIETFQKPNLRLQDTGRGPVITRAYLFLEEAKCDGAGPHRIFESCINGQAVLLLRVDRQLLLSAIFTQFSTLPMKTRACSACSQQSPHVLIRLRHRGEKRQQIPIDQEPQGRCGAHRGAVPSVQLVQRRQTVG